MTGWSICYTFAKNYQKMEIPTYITEVCQQMGYDYAIYLGEYKGEDVYSPIV